MKIQSTRITEQTDDQAVIEMLISESADAEDSGDFLKIRLSIPSAPVPSVSALQLVAFRHVRELVNEKIQALQSLLSQHGVDIP